MVVTHCDNGGTNHIITRVRYNSYFSTICEHRDCNTASSGVCILSFRAPTRNPVHKQGKNKAVYTGFRVGARNDKMQLTAWIMIIAVIVLCRTDVILLFGGIIFLFVSHCFDDRVMPSKTVLACRKHCVSRPIVKKKRHFGHLFSEKPVYL